MKLSKLKSLRGLIFILLLATVTAGIYTACGSKQLREFTYDHAFDGHISAYSSGEISRISPIRIRLAADAVDPAEVNFDLSESPFSFKPDIPGKAVWTDTRTIEFHPSEPLPSNSYYTATFHLGKYREGISSNLQNFPFQFATLRQSFEVVSHGFESIDNVKLEWMALNGELVTADYEFSPLTEQLLTAEYSGNQTKIQWFHSVDGRNHTFRIDSLRRMDAAQALVLSWNGKPLSLDVSDKLELSVPARGEFRALSARVEMSPQQHIVISFSDPVKSGQNFNGLIRIDNETLTFVAEGNDVKVFPARHLSGAATVYVEKGIQNIAGYKLREPETWDVVFEELEPQVRLIGSGNILPRTEGLPFPFEAVSLKSVRVSVMRIFEDNVLQFLQVNDLDGDNELSRVGKTVIDTTMPLNGDKKLNLHSWNRHVIDLSSLFRSEPGAIYRVTIDFEKSDALVLCEDSGDGEEEKKKEENTDEEAEASYWDSYESNYNDDEYDDWWSNRDNPCHIAYYEYNDRGVSRNILASDIGIIAKRGTDESYMFAVTDLVTTLPLPNVTVELFDFQRRLTQKISTDANGFAKLSAKEAPFVVVAKHGSQRGYLKMDDSYSLSLSKFDVSGNSYHKGVKGFIYGERGVWRPGDTLFLSFLLEDKNKSLPAAHPVTLTVTDPRGRIVQKTVTDKNLNGFYSFQVPTRESAPTGDYLAEVSVGGATFSKYLKVETIMPNRLKIEMDFGKETLTKNDKELKAKLASRWLHGAAARNLTADVKLTLSPVKTKFARFQEYTFDDPVRDFSSEYQEIFSGSLDEEGKTEFPVHINVSGQAPGMLSASVMTRVYEPGGNFSTDYAALQYAPYDRFVGIRLPKGDKARGMLLTDTTHTVNISMVDALGNPTGTDSVTIGIYKLSWEWWWDESAENVVVYNGKFYNNLIREEKAFVKDGTGTWKFKIKYPDWGRYMVRVTDKQGHSSGKIIYIDWPGWAGRARAENPEGATMLTLASAKQEYTTGEKVDISIPTGESGRALVSIESGSRVLQSHWIEAKKGGVTFSFTATADMAPGVYVHVTLVQPHEQTANDLPIRLYGVSPVKITDPGTILKPVITMPAQLRPESKVALSVSESAGKAMTYTIAVVDEGLLDLTRFKTPDPWETFYAREALQVKTWDIYDKVIGAYGKDAGKLLAIGGGDYGTSPSEGSKQNRFRPVVVVLGPFELKPGEKKSHEFMMPNYVGSVRAMVIAGNNGAYGKAEKAVPVKKPLMVLGTLPRVLGPGEEVKLPVTVFAMENHVKNVQVTLEATGLLTSAGTTTQSLSFTKPGDGLVEFSMKVKEAVGKGTVKVTARSGNESAVYYVDVDVRNPNPPVTDTYSSYMEAGKTWSQNFTYPGVSGTNVAKLEVSSIPPLNLGQRMRYLMQYPYGCVEQTTSSVFPQVYLTQLFDLPESEKRTIEKNVKAGIERLINQFQQPDGGLSYWPGTGNEDFYGTNYAGTFLLEAQKAGYKLPSHFLPKWVKFQKNAARNWNWNTNEGEQLIQADRLFLLASCGQPELGAMNRMKEGGKLDNVAAWRLAAAYYLAGQREIADGLIKNAGTVVREYNEMSHTYGSTERDRAIILECLSLMDKRAEAFPLMRKISDDLCSKEFMSTQSTGYSLVAMARFAGVAAQGMPVVTFEYRANGGEWKSITTTKPLSVITLPLAATGGGSVEVRNKSTGGLSARVVAEGIPAVGDNREIKKNLVMKVEYKTTSGENLDVSTLEQGTDFIAVVTVENPGTRGDYEELALTQVFPSGWEVLNPRLAGDVWGDPDVFDYMDVRDDRVSVFFDLRISGKRHPWWTGPMEPAAKSKTLRVMLNAAYTGRFYLPPVSAEAMYDAEVSARTSGKWVNVMKPAAL